MHTLQTEDDFKTECDGNENIKITECNQNNNLPKIECDDKKYLLKTECYENKHIPNAEGDIVGIECDEFPRNKEIGDELKTEVDKPVSHATWVKTAETLLSSSLHHTDITVGDDDDVTMTSMQNETNQINAASSASTLLVPPTAKRKRDEIENYDKGNYIESKSVILIVLYIILLSLPFLI